MCRLRGAETGAGARDCRPCPGFRGGRGHGTRCQRPGRHGIARDGAAQAACAAPPGRGGPAPVLVPLAPGKTAYLGINKWLCDGPDYAESRTVQVIPPNDYQALTLTTTHRYPLIGYCPAGDPGHTLNVSPVEPGPLHVMGLHR